MTMRLVTMLSLALLLACPATLSAQESGWGAVVDFIHRLSGPPFIGVAPSFYFPGPEGTRVRLTAAYRVSFNEGDRIAEPDSDITMITLQPTIELPIRNALEVGAGVAFHRFAGDVDAFWHESALLQLQVRPRTDRRVNPRLGVALHGFRAFEDDDFFPLTVRVSRDNVEGVFQFFAGVDIRF